MEFRLVNESAGVVMHVEVKPNGDYWDVIPYGTNDGTSGDTQVYASEGTALRVGLQMVEGWKKECEDDFRKRYGEEPTGIMSPTGYTIETVDD